MTDIVLASNNRGKLKEITAALAGHDFNLIPQSDFINDEAEETGQTFIENALIKARFAAKATGLPAIADDSGLVVDALAGEPGVYSARYAGAGSSDEDNLHKVLSGLKGVIDHARTARFISVMVYLRHPADPIPIIAQGVWEGRIVSRPSGQNGFGYDPIFYVPEHQCTAAELDLASKNQLSHRGQAIRQLVSHL